MKEARKSLLSNGRSEIASRLLCDAPIVDYGVSTDVSLFLVGGRYFVVYSRRRMSHFREGSFGWGQQSNHSSHFRAESICGTNASEGTRDRTARMGSVEPDVRRRSHHSLRIYDIKTCHNIVLLQNAGKSCCRRMSTTGSRCWSRRMSDTLVECA